MKSPWAHHENLHGHFYCLVPRADLRSLLRKAVTGAAPGAISLGARVQDIAETDEHITLRFEDGTEETGDLVIDAVDRDACYRWAPNIRDPVENLRSKRSIVIGDAAHPTLPFIAQGAAMAIGDAMVLTRALGLADVDAALDMFQNARLARIFRMVNGANRMSKMFHHPSEAALRQGMIDGADLAMGRDNWLYNYNPVSIDLGGDVAA